MVDAETALVELLLKAVQAVDRTPNWGGRAKTLTSDGAKELATIRELFKTSRLGGMPSYRVCIDL